MSAQSGKKKRIGSRRRVANQNKTSEAEEFHITDSTSLAQPFISGGNSDSLNVFDNSNNSQSETQKPPSPELPVNRRKLGSSRRNKGEQHVKESELYLRSREEDEEQTKGNETEKTIQPQRQEELSKWTEPATHDSSVLANTPDYSSEICNSTTTISPNMDLESFLPKSENLLADKDEISIDDKVASDSFKLVEAKYGGTGKTDTLQSEELLENAETFGISELTTASVTVKEDKEGDEGKDLLKQDGNLQGNYVVSESHLELQDVEFSITAEVTTDKSSPRENIGLEYSVGQAAFSSSKEKLQIDEEKNEDLNVSEVKVSQHSEDAVNKVHKQEANPTEMREINHSPDRVTQGENSEVIAVYLTDKADVSDTHQSESMVESADDSAAKQEDSDDKQDEHPTNQDDLKALEQTRMDTKIPQISGIQQVHGVLGQVYEVEGQVEDDIMPSAEQTDHQEKEGLISEMEESDSSSQTVQSEIHAPFHSQPLQNNTDSHPLGSRRKLGSSRRHKGRQHAKDSVAESYHEEKDEVVESIRGEEALETTQMLAAIERMSQGGFSQGSDDDIDMPTTHDRSLYADIMPDYSSEVHNMNTSNYQETDLESLTPKSENLQEDDNERESDFKVSGESVGDRLEEMDKLDTVQSQEVRAAQHSEDSRNKVHEQELNLTQMHETDRSSESVTLSDNLTDQAEDSDTNQSELIVESTDDSATKQEDSNPDDKQGVHPAKEDNLEASEQTNEDNDVYDTKQIHIDDIERLDTALAQVYEIEGRLEDDVKLSTEQSVLQEKEGHSSEDEEDRSSKTLPSEIYPPSDSQPQQSDTNFKPIANRRKLGSSRRIKGRQQAKDSAAESYHRPTEEVVGHTEDNESIQTTKMSFTTETAMQEKSVETIQEGIDKCDTTQTGELRQNAYIGISQLTASNVLFSTAGQQLIDQSNSTKMPEELPNVYSVTEKESKDEAEYTKLRQDGNLQDNFLERESHLRSEDMEYFITAKIATEYNSSRERTESQYTVEQAIVSSPKEELSTRGETIEHFNLHEVKVAQHSDDAVHKHEVKPTEMHEIAHYSDNVTHDATEKSEIISGNLIDKAEVSNTNQSESMLESTDDSATKQEDSDPDDKQDEHPTKQEDFKALEQTRVDTKIPQISGIQQVHGVLGQVYEVEGQVEDDIMPSAEQTDHQEKEGLISEMEESDSSSQTVQSEIHAPFHSQPLQNNTDSHPLGSRRKLGSSRRHKGRQHAKDSVAESYHEEKDEVVESIRGEEALETTQMLAAIERMSQGGFSQGSDDDIDMPTTHDRSLYADIMPDYSSEVHNMNTSNYQETDLESLTPKSENLQEDDNERESDFKVSGESVGDRLEEMDKLDTVQSQEVRAAQHSEDSRNKVHEQELNLTQMHETDRSSESVTLSDNLTDQAEDSDTNQSELIVESTDDSATKQEDSNPDDKQGVHPAKEDNLEASEQTNEDNDVYDTKQIHIDDIERLDTALAQVYEIEGRLEDDVKLSTEQSVLQEKEGHSSEDEEDRSSKTLPSEIYPPSDSQPQQSDTNFKPIANRRKLGSSRRIKGRQQAKDSAAESYHRPTEEVVGHTEDNESIQTTKMSFTTETAMQEKSVETIQEGIDTHAARTAQTEDVNDQVKENAAVGIFELTASSLHSSATVEELLVDYTSAMKMPEEERPNLYSVTKRKIKHKDKDTELLGQNENTENDLLRESHLREEAESSVTLEKDTEQHSLGEQTVIECSVDQAAFLSSKYVNESQKEHVSLSQVRGSPQSEDAVNEVHEELVNVRQVQEMHQIGFSSTEESESLQTLQSETNAPLDFQHQDNSLRREEQTHAGFKTTGNRRKLGSSRRNKGRQQVETSVVESSQDVVESRRSDGVLDPTKMSLAVETAKQEEVQKQADLDLRSVPKIRKIRSTVTDEDSTGTMLEKDTVLSQKIMDNSANVTTSVASSSSKDDAFNKDYNEEEKNVTKEPENLAPFIGHGAVKADLIPSPEDDSDIQNISYHDDYITTRPIALDVLEQEIMNMQQTNGATETVGDVTIKDCNTEAETSMDVHVFGERFKDPTKKDQEMNASQEFTHAEPFAAGHNKEDTSAPSSPKENFRAEPAMDVPEESRISTAVGVSDSQQGIQEKTQLDNSGNLQGKSKQKRRKLGSTRRTQLGRKPEEGMDDKDETKDRDDMRNLDEMEVMEVLPMSVTAEVSKNENTKPSLSTANKEEQEATETAAVPDKGQKLQSNNADMQGIQSYMISDIDYSKAIHPEQLASKNEVVNPIKFSHAADLRDSERNVDVNVEPSQLDDFTVSEMHVTSVYTHSDMERPEGVNVIQDQALESAEASAVAVANLEIVKSVVRGEVGEEQKHTQASVQELREVNEEAHNKNLEMRSTSPHRRRKMGSTRRNLGSRSKREDLLEKQDMDGEATATNVEESIKEKEEPQLETEDKDSENVESHFRPPSEQTFEENPVSHGQLVETEHQLTPSYLPVMPSSSPKPDVMSEAAGGRRRKMGSSRKSRGQQSNVSQTPEGDAVTDTQNGGDVASIIDEGVIKTAEEESFGLDRISEVSSKDVLFFFFTIKFFLL